MGSLILSLYPDRAFLYRTDAAGDFDPEARFYLSTYDGKWEGEIWFPEFHEDQMEPSQFRTFTKWQDVIMYCKSIAIWFGVEFTVEEWV